MADKTITIKATMKERWVKDFCSFLKYMEYCGNVGHSAAVGFFADGDGDFHPKFEIDTDYEIVKGLDGEGRTIEILFDAG